MHRAATRAWREQCLATAFQAFQKRTSDHPVFQIFCEENAAWLEDYAHSLETKADQPSPDRLAQGIRFDHVSFAYPGTDRLVLNDVTQFDIIKGTFQADFYLSLTSDRAMPSMDLIFPNGTPASKEVIADEPTFKFYRFTGQFLSTPDLRHFPFDHQNLEIEIEEIPEGSSDFAAALISGLS